MMRTEANHPLFAVEELRCYYPINSRLFWRKRALLKACDGVSFSIHEGSSVAIVGESGSGKSTAVRASLGIIKRTSGTIIWEGKEVEPPLSPRSIQMIFQDPRSSFDPRRSLGFSMREPLMYEGVLSQQEIEERIFFCLSEVGLNQDHLNRYPHQLSGGQLQRIALARALTLQPKLLILDEATSALDLSVQAQILQLLEKLRRDFHVSYLFISHNLALVRHIADWVYVIYLGQLLEEGPTEVIFRRPSHPYTQALLESILREDPREKKEIRTPLGEQPSLLSPPSGCPFRTRCPHAQARCAENIPYRRISTNEGEVIYRCVLEEPPSWLN